MASILKIILGGTGDLERRKAPNHSNMPPQNNNFKVQSTSFNGNYIRDYALGKGMNQSTERRMDVSSADQQVKQSKNNFTVNSENRSISGDNKFLMCDYQYRFIISLLLVHWYHQELSVLWQEEEKSSSSWYVSKL